MDHRDQDDDFMFFNVRLIIIVNSLGYRNMSERN